MDEVSGHHRACTSNMKLNPEVCNCGLHQICCCPSLSIWAHMAMNTNRSRNSFDDACFCDIVSSMLYLYHSVCIYISISMSIIICICCAFVSTTISVSKSMSMWYTLWRRSMLDLRIPGPFRICHNHIHCQRMVSKKRDPLPPRQGKWIWAFEPQWQRDSWTVVQWFLIFRSLSHCCLIAIDPRLEPMLCEQ